MLFPPVVVCALFVAVVADSPRAQEDIPGDACLSDNMVLHDADGRCYRPGERGPCPLGETFQVDRQRAVRGDFKGSCATLCPQGQVRRAADAICIPYLQICPMNEGFRPNKNIFGEVECIIPMKVQRQPPSSPPGVPNGRRNSGPSTRSSSDNIDNIDASTGNIPSTSDPIALPDLKLALTPASTPVPPPVPPPAPVLIKCTSCGDNGDVKQCLDEDESPVVCGGSFYCICPPPPPPTPPPMYPTIARPASSRNCSVTQDGVCSLPAMLTKPPINFQG